jgi:hypothetical protein
MKALCQDRLVPVKTQTRHYFIYKWIFIFANYNIYVVIILTATLAFNTKRCNKVYLIQSIEDNKIWNQIKCVWIIQSTHIIILHLSILYRFCRTRMQEINGSFCIYIMDVADNTLNLKLFWIFKSLVLTAKKHNLSPLRRSICECYLQIWLLFILRI